MAEIHAAETRETRDLHCHVRFCLGLLCERLSLVTVFVTRLRVSKFNERHQGYLGENEEVEVDEEMLEEPCCWGEVEEIDLAERDKNEDDGRTSIQSIIAHLSSSVGDRNSRMTA